MGAVDYIHAGATEPLEIGWHMYLEGNSVNPAYTGAAESLDVSRGN